MSLPSNFPESNHVYHKPKDATDEQCMSLPCWVGNIPVDDKGTQWPVIISRWQFNKEEIDEIIRTGGIWLSVTGRELPPVAVFAENPFD